MTWRKEYGVALVSFQIRSTLDVAAKDFEVSCIAKGASGTELKTYRQTLYETIKPHGVRITQAFFLHEPAGSTLACAR